MQVRQSGFWAHHRQNGCYSAPQMQMLLDAFSDRYILTIGADLYSGKDSQEIGQEYILMQVLNAGIAAVLFNIMYDALLSRRLRWFAMIPIIDYCNHSPSIQV